MAEVIEGADLYDKLREFLDRLPGGFPATESDTDIELLRWMFTPEEAEVEVNLRLVPETAAMIASRCGKTEDETKNILETMVSKGLIFPLRGKNLDLYMALQFIVGFSEQQMAFRMDPESARLSEKYFEESGLNREFARQKQMRVVPVNTAVEVTPAVATYDNLRKLLAEQDTIAVTDCPCRVTMRHLGRECEHAIENELAFGLVAQWRIDSGFGRKVELEEALRLVDEAERAGLVLSPVDAQELIGMCMCGGCCCIWLQSLKLLDRPADHVQSSFQAKIYPNLCDACGTCLERCQMEAIKEMEGFMEIDEARCIGCGLCISTCPQEAVSLVAKPGTQPPAPTFLGMYGRIARERGLPLGKAKWLLDRMSFPAYAKQWKMLHKLHLAQPVADQMAKRGMA